MSSRRQGQIIEHGTTTVTSQGQITIPQKIREAENLKTGSKLSVIDVDGKMVIQKIDMKDVEEAIEILKSIGKLT